MAGESAAGDEWWRLVPRGASSDAVRILTARGLRVELERVVRALDPHVGARVELDDGSMLGVRRAALAPDAPEGIGAYASDERLLLGCAEGVLELLVVQPAGKRPMDASAFLRGHGLPSAR